jgi:hypothetical protein
LRSAAKVAIASAAMSAAAWAIHHLLDINRYLSLGAAMAIAILVFGGACKLLRVEELGELIAVLRFRRAAPRND